MPLAVCLQGYVVEWVGKERPLGDGLKQRWLRVYLPSKVGGAAEGLRMISKGIQVPSTCCPEGQTGLLERNVHVQRMHMHTHVRHAAV